jgi:hypothetical protein
MAVCAVCNREMLTASSCKERYAELVDGRYKRIRWDALEGEPTDESCGDCGVDPGGRTRIPAARRARAAPPGISQVVASTEHLLSAGERPTFGVSVKPGIARMAH